MSRGGRGGSSGRGRGGRKGLDMPWDDEVQSESQPGSRKPLPLFPEDYHISKPKPLTSSEKAHIESLISFREQIYRGPLYTILDPTANMSAANDQNSTTNNPGSDGVVKPPRPNLRAGFDPFNDQEKYTTKYHPKKRTTPDLSQRSCYTLKLFPLELWSVLDPKKRMKKDWDGLTDEQKARIMPGRDTKKRKRGQALQYEDDDAEDVEGGTSRDRKSGSEASGSDDDDVVSSARRRRQKKPREGKPDQSSKQKKGLDAEDDFPDVDQQDEDAEGGDGAAEDQPHDSEFDTDEDDEEGMDDYNAEQYFDDGADDFGGGADDDDDGGGGDTY